MFDPTPISNLIGLNREPTNDEIQAAAKVGLDMLCSVVDSLERIAINLEITTRWCAGDASRRTFQDT